MRQEIGEDQRRLLALCVIRDDHASIDWNLIAREAQFQNGLDRLWNGKIREQSKAAEKAAPLLLRGIKNQKELFERVDRELEIADKAGAKLITVLDQNYPINLRLIFNLPPFLFMRGEISDDDIKSVAVVGTRAASKEGLKQARIMSSMLTKQKITVISGLARGIDTVAHRAALDEGGRTIAVLGNGIINCYPPENRDLLEEITDKGAVVSQFWPTRSPGKDTFPRRNVVTSGLSQGTVVIEASATSGAKMQARLALEHGKKVFLFDPLVVNQPWAKDYIDKKGAIPVRNVDEAMGYIAKPENIKLKVGLREQLTLAF